MIDYESSGNPMKIWACENSQNAHDSSTLSRAIGGSELLGGEQSSLIQWQG